MHTFIHTVLPASAMLALYIVLVSLLAKRGFDVVDPREAKDE
jgi:hypothetical protein